MLLASFALAASMPALLREEAREALPGCTLRLTPRELRGRCPGREPFARLLQPLEFACENGPGACAEARAEVVADLAFLYGPPEAPPLATVVPVLRARRDVDGVLILVELGQAQGRDVAGRAPVHEPFGSEAEILYMIDSETEARAISVGELAALRLAPASLHAATVGNASRLAGEVVVEAVGPVERWSGNGYLSALVFDTERWVAFAGAEPLLLAVPSRDRLLLLHGDAAADVLALRMLAADTYAGAEHPVSRDLFWWTGSGWVRLEEVGGSYGARGPGYGPRG